VIVDEKAIKDSWKEYMEKLMNEENEWDHRISAGIKEGPADCIRIDEVAAALKTRSPAKAWGGRPYCPINLILTLSPSLIDF